MSYVIVLVCRGFFFFFQAEDGIRDADVTGVQTCALPILTPEQVCAIADRIRERLLADTERAEPAGTELALSLTDAQLQQLERKYAKNNAERSEERRVGKESRSRSATYTSRHIDTATT